MVPFGDNSHFFMPIFLYSCGISAGPGLPTKAGPAKPTRIGRGTRPSAQLFWAKQHGTLGLGPGSTVQDFEDGHDLRGRLTDAFGR